MKKIVMGDEKLIIISVAAIAAGHIRFFNIYYF